MRDRSFHAALAAFLACLHPAPRQLDAQTNGWQKVAEYGWDDVSSATRQLSPRERALGGAAFASINGVAEGRDGTIWVLDLLDRKLVLLAPDGLLLTVLGGNGEGPGEFRRPARLAIDRSGAVHVWDQALSRLTTFGTAGSLLSSTIVKTSGLVDFAIAGDTAWFVRPMIRPSHAVVGVLLGTGRVVDSFAPLSARDLEIAAFGSPGNVVVLPDGQPVYLGPRPVQVRMRGASGSTVLGVDRFPSAQGTQLERGTRMAPVAIRASDANLQREIVVLYSSTPFGRDGAPRDSRYFLEVLDASGQSIATTELPVENAGTVAWTRDREVLVGVVDEVPRVWRLKVP
jgi:hypothetical protein